MILEIKYWPDQCLRKVAESIDPTENETKELVSNLFETMYAYNGMGLAATQCDIQKRVLVIDGTLAGGNIKRAFINPHVVQATDKKITTEEGCLSFPGIHANVERSYGIIVETDTLTGGRETVTLESVDAVCFQHELDHLNGIVFYDYLGSVKKRLVDERVRKIVKKINRKQRIK